jgi:hypothetical protein
MRWSDSVEKDLRNLDMVNWKTKAQDRDGEKVYRAGQVPQRDIFKFVLPTNDNL